MKLKLKEIIQENPIVKTFHFELESPMQFKPGQFIITYFTYIKDGHTKKIQRSYSIANSPTKKGYLELTVKKQGLTSGLFFSLKKGDEVEFSGPWGNFFFDETKSKEIVMISAGTGLTPFRSFIQYINDKNLDIKTTLFFSSKSPQYLIYKNELDKLKNKNSKFILTVTQEKDSTWKGHFGRIDKKLLKNNIENLKDSFFYVCGPPQFVRDMAKNLLELGVDPKNIKSEIYS